MVMMVVVEVMITMMVVLLVIMGYVVCDGGYGLCCL